MLLDLVVSCSTSSHWTAGACSSCSASVVSSAGMFARRLRPGRRAGRNRNGCRSAVGRRRRELRRHPRGDRGPLPGRRLQRARRARPERGRPQRHPVELRVSTTVAGDPADDRADGPGRAPTAPRSPARRSTSGIATATGEYSLYSQAVTDENYLRGVQAADDERRRDVHEHLPGLLLGSLAAHPLRGLPEPGHGDRRGQQDRDLPDRAAEGRLRRGLRDRRLRARA